jgi:NAD-dependent DNA ligase
VTNKPNYRIEPMPREVEEVILVNLLDWYDRIYYRTGEPLVSDEVYDGLVERLEELRDPESGL